MYKGYWWRKLQEEVSHHLKRSFSKDKIFIQRESPKVLPKGKLVSYHLGKSAREIIPSYKYFSLLLLKLLLS